MPPLAAKVVPSLTPTVPERARTVDRLHSERPTRLPASGNLRTPVSTTSRGPLTAMPPAVCTATLPAQQLIDRQRRPGMADAGSRSRFISGEGGVLPAA